MAPRISIVLATCRLGGLDVTRRGLLDQTFRDFELILVDYHYERRHAAVRRYFRSCPFPIIHIPPRVLDAPYPDSGQAYNTGLRLARGELVLLWGDYTYGYPEWLADHWRCYEHFEGRRTLIGGYDKYTVPREWCIPDLQRGVVTVFKRPFDPRWFDELPVGLCDQGKGGLTQGEEIGDGWRSVSSAAFYATQHESLPRKLLVDELGGLDEDFDGGWGYADLDLGYRAQAAGHGFAWHPDVGVVKEIDHRKLWPNPPKPPRDGQNNLNLWREKMQRIEAGERWLIKANRGVGSAGS
jgi:glycosyltransferase involved in cell wall biosynthesis